MEKEEVTDDEEHHWYHGLEIPGVEIVLFHRYFRYWRDSMVSDVLLLSKLFLERKTRDQKFK